MSFGQSASLADTVQGTAGSRSTASAMPIAPPARRSGGVPSQLHAGVTASAPPPPGFPATQPARGGRAPAPPVPPWGGEDLEVLDGLPHRRPEAALRLLVGGVGLPAPVRFQHGQWTRPQVGILRGAEQNRHPAQPFVDAGVVVELAKGTVHEASEVLQLFPRQRGEPGGEQQAPLAAHVGLDLARILGELKRGIAQAGQTRPQLAQQ